ncbi:MAG: hypothetical protein OXU61_13845 [Gammaproteobacteria bacterium]|nr:hypothetical protein [Gammaproteobacteria bacterium]
MSGSQSKVVSLESPHTKPASSSNGNGNGTRLAAVEARLTALETHIRYLATKEDIQAMQATMLKWGVGILIATLSGVLFIALRLSAS